jgi:hypothetical protein
MQPLAGPSTRGRLLAVLKQHKAGISLDGGVEELTQGSENPGKRASLPNQFAGHGADVRDAESHPRCCPVFVAMTCRQ